MRLSIVQQHELFKYSERFGDEPFIMSQADLVVNTSTDEESLVSEKPSTGVMDTPTVQENVLKEEDELTNSDYSKGEEGLCSGETPNEEMEDGLDQKQPMKSPQREYEKPSKNLQKKIRTQIEFYFSDKHLKRHPFLIDRIRRYDGGYVSLKFLTTFHNVKAHTRDYRVVADSLRDSEILELNEESTMVHRRVPVPNDIQTARSCKVLAFNLPFKKPTVSSVAELFEPFGEVILIHLLWPGKPIPPAFGREITDHIKQLKEVCVLIQFGKHGDAKEAVAKLKNKKRQKGMRVVRVSEWPYRVKKNAQNSGKQVDIDDKQAGEERSGANEPNIKSLNTKGSHVEEHASTEADGESANRSI